MVNISSIDRLFLDSARWAGHKGRISLSLKRIYGLCTRLFSVVMAIAVGFAILLSFPSQGLADIGAIADTAASPVLISVALSPDRSAVMEDGVDIAAEKVDQFSQAYLQVLQLLSDREAEIPAAETTVEAFKIEKSIEAAAIALIKENGLTLSEYMQILELASKDATFQDKVLGRMDEAQEDAA